MGDVKMKYLKEMVDDKNPDFLFSGVDSTLVIAVALGKVDTKKIAAKEMANRGYDKKNKWVGFPEAEKIWGVK